MVNIKTLIGVAFTATLMIACDDTTDNIGNSLTSHKDLFQDSTKTFTVKTKSLIADSVLSRSQYTYLGHVKDPETRTYVTSNYTTQFAILENLNSNDIFLPSIDSIVSKDNNGVYAESCILRVNVDEFSGNMLNPMKLTVHEMNKPITEGVEYYTFFDPEAEGLLRSDNNAIKKNKMYTPIDQNLSDSIRNNLTSSSSTSLIPINIPLNEKYIDKNNNEYKNFGTYIMQMYYKHPEYFKNSNTFRYYVCPGFYVKNSGGLGVMSKVNSTDLLITFKMIQNGEVATAGLTLAGTEEVVRTTHIKNDKEEIAKLAAEDTCTYLKTPSGIFTEVELPIDSIMMGHENDTISSAKISFTKINSIDSEYEFGAPKTILILPKDSLTSFFKNRDLPDNLVSYISTYQSSYNTYTFNNIASLVTAMYKAKLSGNYSKDWNKAVLVPVTQNTSTSGSSYSSTTKVIDVSNDLSLKSAKLVGGTNNKHQPVQISVIYNRFLKD